LSKMLINESPLFLDGWLEFNRRKWNLEPRIIKFKEDHKQIPFLKTVLYYDKKGFITIPPRNPYLPVEFRSTPTQSSSRVGRQWLVLSGMLSDELYRAGVRGTIPFSPNVTDLRMFQWRGFHVQVRYTFYLHLPIDKRQIDHAVRKQIKKAGNNAFTCSRVVSPEEIMQCLTDTEDRNGFSYGLSVSDIKMAQELLSEEHFRCYGCYAPNGEIASARIILHRAGSRAIDWVAGTKRKFLNSGATQGLIAFALDDLASAGATGFDFAGANIPNVAAAKATWGGRLVPFYIVSAPSLRGILKYAFDIRKYHSSVRR